MDISQHTRTASNAELCERFDADILHDAHSLFSKVRRSSAARELRDRGPKALATIAAHLKRHPKLSTLDLSEAWCTLLRIIETTIDRERTAPRTLTETTDWIAWAERFAVTALA